jgi:hypothetical protein
MMYWFQKIVQENHASFYATTYSLCKFDETINHMEIQSLEILEQRVEKEMIIY